jgi:hypothetical protein
VPEISYSRSYWKFYLTHLLFVLLGSCRVVFLTRSTISFLFLSLRFRPTPHVQSSPVLHQVIKLCQALGQRIRIAVRPAKLRVQDQVGVRKDLGVEQARFRVAKEPLVAGEQGGERAQGVGGVGEELVGGYDGGAGGLEDLGGGGVAESVEGGELEDWRGGEVEGFEEGGVEGIEVESL